MLSSFYFTAFGSDSHRIRSYLFRLISHKNPSTVSCSNRLLCGMIFIGNFLFLYIVLAIFTLYLLRNRTVAFPLFYVGFLAFFYLSQFRSFISTSRRKLCIYAVLSSDIFLPCSAHPCFRVFLAKLILIECK